MKPEVRGAFAYDQDGVSTKTGLKCLDESLTTQSDLEDTDINVIIGRFIKTGVLPVTSRVPRQGDFTGAKGFQESLDLIKEAQDVFMELPARLRGRFNHDPGEFVEFCSDSKNLPELRRLGLAEEEAPPPVPPPPIRVEMVEREPKKAP